MSLASPPSPRSERADASVVVFAGDAVGLAVGRTLAARGERCTGLVLDAADPKGVNAALAGLRWSDQVRPVGRRWSAEDLAWLRALAPDWIVLAWWPYLVDPAVIGAARDGCLNFHPSLLPDGAGRNPNFWALVEGTPFGVTIHHVTEVIDGGDIAWQAPLPVSWEDTGASLHARAGQAVVELFARHWDELKRGEVPRHPQPAGARRYHRGDAMQAASVLALDERRPVREVLDLIRARTFEPHPAVRFEDAGRTYEVRISIREVKP